MRKNIEKFVESTVAGFVAVAGYELVKTVVQVIKSKQALTEATENLENVTQLMKEAEKIKH